MGTGVLEASKVLDANREAMTRAAQDSGCKEGLGIVVKIFEKEDTTYSKKSLDYTNILS